ncbi:hypothetical protein LOK49_LG04G03737 [Camellia lanceoleosa]|uniref:Uncharacterized protein n=1 Tax=Camellia lanceoleosa TaxID=1840588 RepID=A0ACC0I801_9ERIC|nr:hypothetical protein LOK49_LG04G03737 [Camellia lanceoleosa]
MEITAKEKNKEDHLTAVWFALIAAGTAALVVCLQRAAVVEQWRVWVFLALNLLLLAILFTSSTRTATSWVNNNDTSVPSDEASEESNTEAQHKINGSKIGRKQCRRRVMSADEDERDEDDDDDNDDDDAKLTHQLSKEELNERVEAFIAMFRRQLVSDAKDRSRFRFSSGPRLSQHCLYY